ncbi:hypothetical protein [Rhodococcus wratislaviensis]|uniref:hypothetical protein n=1 Tax=Rhodococcus wratislaviensis TaxID=44752 RepID=UPI003669C03E
MIPQLTFLTVVACITSRAVMLYSRRRLHESLVSLLGSWMYVLCLWIPAQLQNRGLLRSKIQEAGILAVPSQSDIADLSWNWSMEIVVIFAAELVAVSIFARVRSQGRVSISLRSESEWKSIALILCTIGLFATLAFPPDLINRGAEGQGVYVILRTMLVCGLAVLAYFGGFARLWIRVSIAAGAVFLVFENVRSPLLVVVMALFAGLLSRGSLYRRTRLVQFGSLVLACVLAGSFMSEMRANVTRDLGRSGSEVLESVMEEPWLSPYEAGIDTLDGYRFSIEISQYEAAKPLDLLSPVTTFIPRSLWPEKPQSVSVELSAKYLGYRSSGQFLSPIGYLRLATGSYILAMLLFFLAFTCFTAMVLRLWKSFWLTVILVVIFRFLLGGSAFDLYYGIMLSVSIWAAVLMYDLFFSSNRLADGRRHPGLSVREVI